MPLLPPPPEQTQDDLFDFPTLDQGAKAKLRETFARPNLDQDEAFRTLNNLPVDERTKADLWDKLFKKIKPATGGMGEVKASQQVMPPAPTVFPTRPGISSMGDVKEAERVKPAATGMGEVKALPAPPPDTPPVILNSRQKQRLQQAPPKGKVPGMVEEGNIKDLYNRPVLNNPDGSYSTTSSMSFSEGGPEILIPTVVDGKRLTEDQAIAHYHETGEHLGKFDTPEHADAYANGLHESQALKIDGLPKTPPIKPGPAHGVDVGPLDVVKQLWNDSTKSYQAAKARENQQSAAPYKKFPEPPKEPAIPLKDIAGSVVKQAGGLLHGASMGYYDPEKGVVNLPNFQGAFPEVIEPGPPANNNVVQVHTPLSLVLQRDWGVSPDIAQDGTADAIGSFVGMTAPWSKISSGITGALNATKAAAVETAVAKGIPKAMAKTVQDIAEEILKHAGIQAASGATYATLESTSGTETAAEKAKRIGETALYGAAFSVLADSFSTIFSAGMNKLFPGPGGLAESADKVVNDIYDIFYRSGRFTSEEQAAKAADRAMKSVIEKFGNNAEELAAVREAAERRFASEAQHANEPAQPLTPTPGEPSAPPPGAPVAPPPVEPVPPAPVSPQPVPGPQIPPNLIGISGNHGVYADGTTVQLNPVQLRLLRNNYKVKEFSGADLLALQKATAPGLPPTPVEPVSPEIAQTLEQPPAAVTVQGGQIQDTLPMNPNEPQAGSGGSTIAGELPQAPAGVPPTNNNVTPASSDPTSPPGPRWQGDRGAMPGEPAYFLDGETEEDAKAAIIENEVEGGGFTYTAWLNDGRSFGPYGEISLAAQAAEAAVDGAPPKPLGTAEEPQVIKAEGSLINQEYEEKLKRLLGPRWTHGEPSLSELDNDGRLIGYLDGDYEDAKGALVYNDGAFTVELRDGRTIGPFDFGTMEEGVSQLQKITKAAEEAVGQIPGNTGETTGKTIPLEAEKPPAPLGQSKLPTSHGVPDHLSEDIERLSAQRLPESVIAENLRTRMPTLPNSTQRRNAREVVSEVRAALGIPPLGTAEFEKWLTEWRKNPNLAKTEWGSPGDPTRYEFGHRWTVAAHDMPDYRGVEWQPVYYLDGSSPKDAVAVVSQKGDEYRVESQNKTEGPFKTEQEAVWAAEDSHPQQIEQRDNGDVIVKVHAKTSLEAKDRARNALDWGGIKPRDYEIGVVKAPTVHGDSLGEYTIQFSPKVKVTPQVPVKGKLPETPGEKPQYTVQESLTGQHQVLGPGGQIYGEHPGKESAQDQADRLNGKTAGTTPTPKAPPAEKPVPPSEAKLTVGQRVTAQEGPGTVHAISGSDIKLRMDDGTISKWIPARRVTAAELPAAPVEEGTSPEETKEIAEAFDRVQQDDQVTHVFDPPTKKEIIRINDKVKGSRLMTIEEAKKEIEKWKEHAAKQGETRQNTDKVVLSLFDKTGQWSQPWVDAGYHVVTFDIQTDPEFQDVNNFSVEYFNDMFGSFEGNDVYAILAACPCTDFASSGARHFAAKDEDGRTHKSIELVKQTLATIEFFKPMIWAIENPVGRIESLTGLPPWRLSFDPNHFGEPYTKKTLLWGRFNGDLPTAPVDPTEGSKMHQKYGGSSQATKNARSVTPEGFAYSFFMANNAMDHPVMEAQNKYDRLDKSVVKDAVDAGMSLHDIGEVVDDSYYMDLDDRQAEKDLKAAAQEYAEEKPASTPAPAETGKKLPAPPEGKESPIGPLLTTEWTIQTGDQPRRNLSEPEIRLLQSMPEIAREAVMKGDKILPPGQGKLPAPPKAQLPPAPEQGPVSAKSPYHTDDKVFNWIENFVSRHNGGMPTPGEVIERFDSLTESQAASLINRYTSPAPETKPTGKFKYEVQTDDTGKWSGNAKTYDTEQEALDAGHNLMDRWMAVRDVRVVPVEEPAGLPAPPKAELPAAPKETKAAPAAPKYSDKEADETLARIKARLAKKGPKPGAMAAIPEVDHELMADLVKYGSYHYERGLTEQAAWNKQMLEAIGDSVKPYLRGTFATIEDMFAQAAEEELAQQPKQEETETNGRPIQNPEGKGGNLPSGGAAETGKGTEGVGKPGAGDRPTGKAGTGDTGTVPEKGTGSGGNAGTGKRRPDAPAGRSVKNPGAYRITDADNLGAGGPTAKFRGNIEAIKTLKSLMTEGRLPTDAERKTLARYVGWGGLSEDAFSVYNREFKDLAKELEQLLTPEEYAAAKASTKNAHYTSAPIVKFNWALAERLGFKGGTFLDPSTGTGNYEGLMPEGLLGKTDILGVELDPITGNIAKYLYPEAKMMLRGYEDVVLPDNSIDFAASNVPFGPYPVYDPRYKALKIKTIHDYYFIKTLDKVRPGGIVQFITSKGTMDKVSPKIRQLIADKANLIAAYRFPNDAFKANANTSVTTDLIILQKRAVGEPLSGETFIDTKEIAPGTEDNEAIVVNEYFARHPENMFGRMDASGTMYRGGEPQLIPTGDLEKMMAEALERAPKNVMKAKSRATVSTPSIIDQVAPDNVKELAYTINQQGQLVQRVDGVLTKPGDPTLGVGAAFKQMKALIDLREAVKAVIATQLSTADDVALKADQDRLNELYDAYVKTHGFLNENSSKIFKEDPQYPLLLALENFNRETGKGAKSDMFSKRTIQPVQPLDRVSPDPKEALLQVLGDRGFPDIDFMAELAGKPTEELANELIEKGLIFKDPETGAYETAANYLSGFVREKLAKAIQAAQDNKAFEKNVEALSKVQPETFPIDDPDPNKRIAVKLGTSWIPEEAYKAFITDRLAGSKYADVTVKRLVDGSWVVKFNATQDAKLKWGTRRIDPESLLEKGMNLRRPTIIDKDDDGTKTVNQDETLLAREKLETIKAELQDWAGKSPTWSKKLEAIYNGQYNGITLPEYDGSALTLPGISSSIKLMPHQLNGIQRIITDGRALLAHVVGAGKSFEMIAAGMELRRLGISKKNMYAVPNGKVGQFRDQFLALYPAANVLAIGKEDLAAENRKKSISRIATGDWDAVILQHSSFGRIPISNQYLEATINKELDELQETYNNLPRDERGTGKRKTPTVKALEKAMSRLTAKLKELADSPKDDTIKFDELGVDYLFVDELHEFKKLVFYTKLGQISGMPQGGSDKAFDLKTKTDYILAKNGGNRGVIGATGTPVSNSMAEVYNMIRYVAPDILEKYGIKYFDDWASNFGEVIEVLELSPDGRTYRKRTKFAKFSNGQQLISMFRAFTDVKMAHELDLPTPELAGGKIQQEAVPTNDVIEPIFQQLLARAEHLRADPASMRVKGNDNWLTLTNDGKKVALDARLFDASLGDHPESKENQAISNIYDRWVAGKKDKTTQVVFADNYHDRSGKFNLYYDMRDKLIARGVPASEIVVSQDMKNDEQLETMQSKMNAGEIRVLFGSTAKIGVGLNIQERLAALHDLDAPWRPDQLEQRHGRIMRQGNLHREWKIPVEIMQYVTKRSFDAYIFQALETKARFIGQIMSGKMKGQDFADPFGDTVLNYAELKAIASDNPDVKRQMELSIQLTKLTSLEQSYEREMMDRRRTIEKNNNETINLRTHLDQLQEAQQQYIDYQEAHPEKEKKSVLEDEEEAASSFDAVVGADEFKARKDLVAYLDANRDQVFVTGNGAKLYGVPVKFENVLQASKKWQLKIGDSEWFNFSPTAYLETFVSRLKEKTGGDGELTYKGNKVSETSFGKLGAAEVSSGDVKWAGQPLSMQQADDWRLRFFMANEWNDIPETGSGFLTRVRTELNRLPVRIENTNGYILQRESSNAKIAKEMEKPFSHAEELAEAQAEMDEVTKRLTPKPEDEAPFSDDDEDEDGESKPVQKKKKTPVQQLPPVRVDGIPYSSSTTTIATPDGDKEVQGYFVAPGLIVTKALDYKTKFQVTHAMSGKAIPATLSDSAKEAIQKAVKLVNVTDWTQDEKGLNSVPDIGTKIKKALESTPPPMGHGMAAVPGSKGLPAPPKTKLETAAEDIHNVADFVKKALAPGTRGLPAEITAPSIRKLAATVEAKKAQAERALKDARKYFEGKAPEHGYEFIDAIENDDIERLPKEEQKFAEIVRNWLDDTWAEVQSRNGIKTVIDDYFPHLWADPNKAAEAITGGLYGGKRPLEGKKAFLKKRQIATFSEGLEAGLTPKFENPIDAVLAQLHQEVKFITAHDAVKELKALGVLKFRSVFDRKADLTGLAKIDDPIGTVYGPPTVTVKEAYDEHLFNELNEFAKSLGIEHFRKVNIGKAGGAGEAWGYALYHGSDTEPDKIWSKVGGPETVITHEIGHILDHRYGLQARLDPYNDELDKLAEQRHRDKIVPAEFEAYVKTPSERIANLVHAMVHTPELAEEIAPKAVKEMTEFLNEHDELKPLLDIKPSLVLGSARHKMAVGGMVIRGYYWAPESAAKLINNYLSPGLSGNKAFQIFRAIGNTLNQVQLGLSGFHFTFTAMDAAISKGALGLQQLAQGDIKEGLKNLAMGNIVIAPWTTYLKGSKVLKQFYDGGQGEYYARVIDSLIKAGGRVKMDSFYKNSAVEKFWDAWGAGRIASLPFRGLFALMEYSSKPLMEHWVPRVKLGVFAELSEQMLKELPDSASELEKAQVLARAWDSVDNRMGQLVYDNLFWNKTTKDIGMAMVRSLGWNLGTWRELGGGAIDVAKGLTGRGNAFVSGKYKTKKMGPDSYEFKKKFRLPPRVAYALWMTATVALMGAIYQYLRTGKGPSEFKDLPYPKTGNKLPNGEAERVSLPSYAKDIYAYGHDVPDSLKTTFGHKLHPEISVILQMLENKDYYGTEIRHEDDPVVEQLKDAVTFIGEQYVPFSLRNMQQRDQAGASIPQKVETFFGVTPAPKSLSETPAERLAAKYMEASMPAGSRTKFQFERSQTRSQLVREFNAHNKNATTDLQQAIKDGKLTQSDVDQIKWSTGMSAPPGTAKGPKEPLERMLKSANLEQVLNVFDIANPEEKQLLIPMLRSRVYSKALTPQERKTLYPRALEALKFRRQLSRTPGLPAPPPN